MKSVFRLVVICLSIWQVLLNTTELSRTFSTSSLIWDESIEYLDSVVAQGSEAVVGLDGENFRNTNYERDEDDNDESADENGGRRQSVNRLTNKDASDDDNHQLLALSDSKKQHSTTTNVRETKLALAKRIRPLKLQEQQKAAKGNGSLSHSNRKQHMTIRSPFDSKEFVTKGSPAQSQATTKREHLPLVRSTQEEEQTTKPRLIIHIGPSKTGTSTIQRESSNYFSEALEADNYYYVGKFGIRRRREKAKIANLFNTDECFHQAADDWRENRTSSFAETECWRKRIAGIEEYRQKKQSLILSDESYSYVSKYGNKLDPPDYYELLHAAFHQDWNVLVVPTYRRYYEWVISVAKEKNRKGCHRTNIDWKHRKCENLWKKINQMLLRDDFEGWPYVNLDVTVPTWRNAGFNVSILNFHDERHLTCSFYCDIIPNTPRSCEFCLQRPSGEQHNLQDVAMTAYNDIVYEAARKGIIDTTTKKDTTAKRSRHELTDELAHYHKTVLSKSFRDLPLNCPPTNVLEALLSKSLVLEMKLLPDLFRRPQGEEEHREAFWRAANEDRVFCSVDTKALLAKSTSWEQVLLVLNATTTIS